MKPFLAFFLLAFALSSFAGEKGNGLGNNPGISIEAGRRLNEMCPRVFFFPKAEEEITLVIDGKKETLKLTDVYDYCCYEAKLSICEQPER